MTSKRSAAKPHRAPKLSRTHAPDRMSPADWQRALRRQFGQEQAFSLDNLGTQAYFSEFRVGNPAVLEQRIARIHRMGQKKPVRVVNYIAKGTIEESMLSVLAFKRSLAEGILDGGAGEILLGGSRLTRFMKDIEKVTQHIVPSEAMAAGEEAAGGASASGDVAEGVAESASGDASAGPTAIASAKEPPRSAAVDAQQPAAALEPWSGLLQFGTALASALTEPGESAAAAHPWVVRNAATGERSLKLPLPSPETAKRLADVLATISDALQRNGGANRS